MKIDDIMFTSIVHPTLGSISLSEFSEEDATTPWRDLLVDPDGICSRIVVCEVESFYVALAKYLDAHPEIAEVTIDHFEKVTMENRISINFLERHGVKHHAPEDWVEATVSKLSPGFITRFNNMQFILRRAKFINKFQVRHFYDGLRMLFGERWVDAYLDSSLGFHTEFNKTKVVGDGVQYDIPTDVLTDETLPWMGKGLFAAISKPIVAGSAYSTMGHIRRILDGRADKGLVVTDRLGKYALRAVELNGGEWKTLTRESDVKLAAAIKASEKQCTYPVLSQLLKTTGGEAFTSNDVPALTGAVVSAF